MSYGLQMPICKSIVRQSYGHLRAGPRRPRLRLGYGWGAFCKAFALHEVTSETESRARLVKNEACDPKHLGNFRLTGWRRKGEGREEKAERHLEKQNARELGAQVGDAAGVEPQAIFLSGSNDNLRVCRRFP